MREWIVGNGWWAYGLPLVVCVLGYLLQAVDRVNLDEARRRSAEDFGGYYAPSITVGHLIAWALVAAIPVANAVRAVGFGFHLFAWAVDVLGDAFARPLVPRRRREG